MPEASPRPNRRGLCVCGGACHSGVTRIPLKIVMTDKATRKTTVIGPTGSRHFRALFISDVHLGTRSSRADALLDLLRTTEADTIYLVGDIVDFWKVRRGPYWPQAHNDVLQKLLRKVRKGCHIVFIPGNHDDGLRDYAGMTFGGIEILRDTVHTAADGRRYVVMHGDEFDIVVRTARWLAYLGDQGYELALWLDQPLNWVRRHLGLGFWSLSAYLKYRVKSAVAFIGAFEEAVATEARKRGVNGVICGHIHHALPDRARRRGARGGLTNAAPDAPDRGSARATMTAARAGRAPEHVIELSSRCH
jgi:UDP-2,3-diacylglucosamine pyrophosphatase LpxH